MRGGQNRLLTPEQHEYFVQHNTGTPQKKMAELMNERFGLYLTAKQINSYRKNHHLSSGLTGRFEKGHVPWSKGRRMPTTGRTSETQFKKGRRPHNYLPVGSERINTDGYFEIKVADPNRWKGKHILVWEALHGPRPKGGKIIFADGNHANFDSDNLLLVTSAELCRMNQNGWINSNAELTKTGAMLAKLVCVTSKRREKKQEERK